MKKNAKAESREPRHWILLIHQLPPRPLYLRAKIRNRLARVGAVALKRSVYVLPRREDCLEDFQGIAREAVAGGGEAFVCEARFLEAGTDEALVAGFREDRKTDYRALAAEIEKWSRSAGLAESLDEAAPELVTARKRFEEISRIDFFASDGKEAIRRSLERLDRKLRSRRTAGSSAQSRARKALEGRTWVTRRGIQVDRIASAWLVRRFVDGKARFRFIDSQDSSPKAGEISFDMVGGDFTHEGDQCTFETLIERTGVSDPTLVQIAEVVHDIDLKDGKFGRPEAPGVALVLTGLVLTNPEDAARLERGMLLFDELYQSLRTRRPGISKEARP